MVNNTEMATNHIENFFYNFYKYHPELLEHTIYLFGESYAGHYVPAFASRLMSNNTVKGLKFNGVAIGDGWTDPYTQMREYDSYFYAIGVASAQRKHILKSMSD